VKRSNVFLIIASLALSLDKAIARVAVVVDPVLLLELLDVVESPPGVGARDAVTEGLAGVEQDLLEAARQAAF